MTEAGTGAPSAPSMGLVEKLTGIFFSPAKVFAAVAGKPGWDWIVPLVFLAVCVLTYQGILQKRFDKEAAISETMAKIEANPRIPADQKAGIEERVRGQFEWGEKPIGKVISVLTMLVPVFVVPLLYKGISAAFGLKAGYMKLVAGYAWCMVVTGLYWLLGGVVALPRSDIPLFEMQHMLVLKSNPAAFMGQASSVALVTMLSFVDVFVIWGLFLRATMLEKVAGFGKGASWAVAGTVLGLWILIRAALAALGQMFGG